MKRLTLIFALLLLAGAVTAAGGYSAHSANGLCVGSKAGCSSLDWMSYGRSRESMIMTPPLMIA